jgi:hypothetical protein
MCDRFATRYLVDRFGIDVRDERGQSASRDEWDFQDLDSFVERARDRRMGRPSVRQESVAARAGGQLSLFPT